MDILCLVNIIKFNKHNTKFKFILDDDYTNLLNVLKNILKKNIDIYLI